MSDRTVDDCIHDIQYIAADPNNDDTWARTRIMELCLEAQTVPKTDDPTREAVAREPIYPEDLDRSLRNAYRIGWQAKLDGKPRAPHPFPPSRDDLRRAYERGWDCIKPTYEAVQRAPDASDLERARNLVNGVHEQIRQLRAIGHRLKSERRFGSGDERFEYNPDELMAQAFVKFLADARQAAAREMREQAIDYARDHLRQHHDEPPYHRGPTEDQLEAMRRALPDNA